MFKFFVRKSRTQGSLLSLTVGSEPKPNKEDNPNKDAGSDPGGQTKKISSLVFRLAVLIATSVIAGYLIYELNINLISRLIWPIATSTLVFAWLLYLGFRKVPLLYKGVLLQLGKRTDVVLEEGWHFIVPFFHGISLVSMQKKTESIEINDVFTPEDQAEIYVTIDLTWQPDDEDLSNFLSVENPIKQLTGMIAETIRGFASDPNNHPSNWTEAVGMAEKFSRMVVAKLKGDIIPRKGNGEMKLESEMSPEELQRKQETEDLTKHLARGEGNFPIPGLHLKIHRFNIVRVEPNKTLLESLNQIAKEEQQQRSETIEGLTTSLLIKTHLAGLAGITDPKEVVAMTEDRVEELCNKFKTTTDSIFRRFQVERKKATGDVKEVVVKIDDGQDFLGAIATALATLAATLTGKK